MTRVSEPTVAYVGRWNGRDHRRYIRTAKFMRRYTRTLGKLYRPVLMRAARDRVMYGSSFIRVGADGIERIDPVDTMYRP